MELRITGASNWIQRLYEACGEFQWVRELAKNAWEAGANFLEFGIEWEAVEKLGVYRRTICDNGKGMSRNDLLSFFSTLGEGDKPIGGVHDNYGIGGKISIVTWNPEGVVIISVKDHKASMIQIVFDQDSKKYELVEWELGDNRRSPVVDPALADTGDDIDWVKIIPAYIKKDGHGTVIVLVGSETCQDTVLGNAGIGENGKLRGISKTLNSRFWTFPSMEIVVQEFQTQQKTQWPTSYAEFDEKTRAGSYKSGRRIRGAEFYVLYDKWLKDECKGKLAHSGTFAIDANRVAVHWYLWEGERPRISDYAQVRGYIAVRYNGELFGITTLKSLYRNFGILDADVQKNVTIILEPLRSDGKWGIFPDNSRNALRFVGHDGISAASDLPLGTWGHQFSNNMPAPILDAIRVTMNRNVGTLENDAYRKRLQERFGTRWMTQVKVTTDGSGHRDSPRDCEEETHPTRPEIPKNPNPTTWAGNGSRKGRTFRVRARAIEDALGERGMREISVNVDVPHYAWLDAKDFENPWHAATWLRKGPKGPTVYLNRDSSIFIEARDFFKKQYPAHLADDVVGVVDSVYGEVAVAKIAHIHASASHLPETYIDEQLLTESSLTVALSGIISEDSLISQKLKSLGKRLTEEGV